jgi:hypothetical protein
MTSMPHLCIDPHLLSLPRTGTFSLDDIEDFVSTIVDWGKTVGGKCTTALVSSTVLDAIDEDDAFPWRDKLVSVLKHYKVKSADSETVSSVVQAFLNCARIEDTVGLKALLLNDKITDVAPAFVCERLRPKTRSAFCEMLAMIIMVQHGHGREVEHVALASIPGDDVGAQLQYLSFSAEIAEFEWKTDPDDKNIQRPYAINDRLSVFFSRNGLLGSIEPLSLWPSTTDVGAASNAIDCCISRLAAVGSSAKHRTPYSIGTSFLDTAQHRECGHEGRHAFTLIESCARIVLNIPKHEVKPLFDNRGKQQSRSDGALAYRTHLTKRGAALRLMLWKLPDGTIEFANVGEKTELVIL